MRKRLKRQPCLRAPANAPRDFAWAAVCLLLGAAGARPAEGATSTSTNTVWASAVNVTPPDATTNAPVAAPSPDEVAPAIPPAETPPPKTRLTWEQCVRLALAHNPDLEVFRDDVLNRDAARRGSYALLYPQIALSFGATRNYDRPGFGAPSNYANEFTGQVSLTQTIFNGFLTQGNIAQARAELALAFANLDSQKALTSYDLKTAFAQVIYAQEDVAVARRVIDVNQQNARLVKLLYDSGNEDQGAYELTRANLDQSIFVYNQAVRNVEVSDEQLVTILGQEVPRPLEAVGELETAPLPIKPDFHALAVQTPAYFQRRAEVDASAAGLTIAQAAFYPTLGIDATASRGGEFLFPRSTTAAAGVTVSYDLFDGGQNYFNVRAARASLLSALASLRSGTDNADLALAQDFKSLVDAVENRRIQQELLDATQLRYTIAEGEYRTALISFQDFNDITSAYVAQLQTTLAAKQSAVNAEANWEQARGLGAIP
jgi:outer membrane protein TolC